ncbi:MAG TPA: GAF domain-containing protein [Ilumatobacter sp.]|nr:GAF domain-containing protein [Ilumatobacter sp.]
MVSRAGPDQLRRLVASVLAVGSELDVHHVLDTIVRTSTELLGAKYGALGVLDESRTRLVDFLTVGIDAQQHAQIGSLPEGHGILGLLIVDPKPLRLPDLTRHPDSFGFPPGHPQMTSFLGVPIAVRGEVFGNLYLCDKTDGEEFDDADVELAVGLAAAAGVAIENARLHAKVAEFATITDRERIARDLHDTVIQRLFAVGLSLQTTIRLVEHDGARGRLSQAVDDLDTTVRDIRAAIFDLHTTEASGRSVRHRVLDVCTEYERVLRFEPVVRFAGPVDTAVTEQLSDDVVAVIRESLSNVARHASATSVEVLVRADGDGVTISVSDNGVGLSVKAGAGRGLSNLSERADQRGGSFAASGSEGGGTTAIWVVPLSSPNPPSPQD